MPVRKDVPVPPPPEGWVSSTHTKSVGWRGGGDSFKHKLEHLQTELVRDLQAAGFSKEEAIATVDHNLVGVRRHPHPGSRPTLYASADAVAMLKEQDRRELPPTIPTGWRSIDQLSKTHYIGDVNRRAQKFAELRHGLLRDLQAAGFSDEEAIAVVDRNLVGKRRPTRGPIGMYASPDAIGILERQGRIRRRDQPDGHEKETTSRSPIHYYIRNDELAGLRAALISGIAALGVSLLDATALVDRSFQESLTRRYPGLDRAAQDEHLR